MAMRGVRSNNYFLSLVATIKKKENEEIEIKLHLLFQSHTKILKNSFGVISKCFTASRIGHYTC